MKSLEAPIDMGCEKQNLPVSVKGPAGTFEDSPCCAVALSGQRVCLDVREVRHPIQRIGFSPNLRRREILGDEFKEAGRRMCKDARAGDFVSSRIRFLDLPALLLLHRPVRCRMCKNRYFLYRGTTRRRGSNKAVLYPPYSFFPKLWVAYAFSIVSAVVAVGYSHPDDVLQIRADLAKVIRRAHSSENPMIDQFSRHFHSLMGEVELQ